MNDTAAPAAPQGEEVAVTLDSPIQRGDTTIASVTLRKPRVGDLRGLKVSDLMTTDVDAIGALLPRITRPTLVKHEIDAMDPADFAQLAGEVAGFLLPKAARASLPA